MFKAANVNPFDSVAPPQPRLLESVCRNTKPNRRTKQNGCGADKPIDKPSRHIVHTRVRIWSHASRGSM